MALALALGADAFAILLKGLLRSPAMLQTKTNAYVDRCPHQSKYDAPNRQTNRRITLDGGENEPANEG